MDKVWLWRPSGLLYTEEAQEIIPCLSSVGRCDQYGHCLWLCTANRIPLLVLPGKHICHPPAGSGFAASGDFL